MWQKKLPARQRAGPAIKQNVMPAEEEPVFHPRRIPKSASRTKGAVRSDRASSRVSSAIKGRQLLLAPAAHGHASRRYRVCERFLNLPPVDHLHWLFQTLPEKRGTQDGMPLHHALPRALEPRNVQVAFDREKRLLEIESRIRRINRVEQHPLLHRRERVDIFQIRQLRLFQFSVCSGHSLIENFSYGDAPVLLAFKIGL